MNQQQLCLLRHCIPSCWHQGFQHFQYLLFSIGQFKLLIIVPALFSKNENRQKQFDSNFVSTNILLKKSRKVNMYIDKVLTYQYDVLKSRNAVSCENKNL